MQIIMRKWGMCYDLYLIVDYVREFVGCWFTDGQMDADTQRCASSFQKRYQD